MSRWFTIFLGVVLQAVDIHATKQENYWNQAAFNRLKVGLKGDLPFVVITIARNGNGPLHAVNETFVRLIIQRILSINGQVQGDLFNIKDFTDQIISEFKDRSWNNFDETKVNKLEEYKMKYKMAPGSDLAQFLSNRKQEYLRVINNLNQQCQNIKLLIQSSPGLLIFNEYFWGNSIIPIDEAKDLATRISSLSANKVLFYNAMIQSRDPTDVATKEAQLTNLKNFIEAANKDYGAGIKIPDDAKRCYTSVQLDCVPKPNQCDDVLIANRTLIALNNQVVGLYDKSTYYKECDNAIKLPEKGSANGFYSFGDSEAKYNQEVDADFKDNFGIQICRDYLLGCPNEANF